MTLLWIVDLCKAFVLKVFDRLSRAAGSTEDYIPLDFVSRPEL